METSAAHGDDAAGGAVRLTREISLCWLARALRTACVRLRVHAATGSVELLSVTRADADAALLTSLVHAWGRQQTPGANEGDATPLRVRNVGSVDDLPLCVAGAARAARVVVVCMEIGDSDGDACDVWTRHLRASTESDVTLVCVGFSIHRTLSVRITVHPSPPPSPSPSTVDLEAALAPLRQLPQQCGLPITLELLAKLLAPKDLASTDSETASPPPFSLFAAPAVAQLPFQLMLMLLRWSCFHPRVFALVTKPFTRKLALIPQPRVRDEILALHSILSQLWESTISSATATTQLLETMSPPRRQQLRLPVDELDATAAAADDDALMPPLGRLSQCALWDKQKQFYRDQGIHAWSHHLIPFGVSSSSYLAMQYARLAVDFLRLHHHRSSASTPSSIPHRPNCFVWEAASGSCKFLHAFLLHFYDLVATEKLDERFGIVPCVVASDLSSQVVQSREEMACFQSYLADGRLDFALFDTDAFLHGNAETERGVLQLRHAKQPWRVSVDGGPAFIIGNYFFDSLRTDVFVVTREQRTDNGAGDQKIEIREARIDSTADNIPDMLFSLAKLNAHPRDRPVYSHVLNETLVATINRLESEWSANTTHAPATTAAADDSEPIVLNSSLLLFPVEAIEFLDAVMHRTAELSGFPVAVVTGDATVSFRDSVPNSFIDEDTGDLEIPQLSPHPDCFCLPVDLEILQLSITASSSSRSSAAIVSTPSSDTFNVFFAQSSHAGDPNRSQLERRFIEVFDQFTPCDCDLLWGMMSVDQGAQHLSFGSQMALLAQTAWDFDVFTALQWGLLHEWQAAVKALELVRVSDVVRARKELERTRAALVEAGRRSRRTLYVMDESVRSAAAALTILQLARWFYELGAYADVADLLDFSVDTHPRLVAGSLYLRGLASFHAGDFWAALSWFRQGQQVDPRRQRLKQWVARTLLRLQGDKLRTERERQSW